MLSYLSSFRRRGILTQVFGHSSSGGINSLRAVTLHLLVCQEFSKLCQRIWPLLSAKNEAPCSANAALYPPSSLTLTSPWRESPSVFLDLFCKGQCIHVIPVTFLPKPVIFQLFPFFVHQFWLSRSDWRRCDSCVLMARSCTVSHCYLNPLVILTVLLDAGLCGWDLWNLDLPDRF